MGGGQREGLLKQTTLSAARGAECPSIRIYTLLTIVTLSAWHFMRLLSVARDLISFAQHKGVFNDVLFQLSVFVRLWTPLRTLYFPDSNCIL